jgi:hypothetical protein
VAQATVGADGRYAFAELQPSPEGYTLLFAQEWNPHYAIDQVISWGWLTSIALAERTTVALPDLDLSLLGLRQVAPEPDAVLSAAGLSAGSPAQFEWTPYPRAARYWVDLSRGGEPDPIWQSALVEGTSLSFDGALSGGSSLAPGEYWWGVGVRQPVGSYIWTVYGYQQRLFIGP